MSISHRPLAGAYSPAPAIRLPRTRHQGWGHTETAESATAERQGDLTSLPWEGLYSEANETSTTVTDLPPQPTSQLELFLNSLMYGE